MQELKFLKQKYLSLVAHIFHFKVKVLREMGLLQTVILKFS